MFRNQAGKALDSCKGRSMIAVHDGFWSRHEARTSQLLKNPRESSTGIVRTTPASGAEVVNLAHQPSCGSVRFIALHANSATTICRARRLWMKPGFSHQRTG